jgi:Fur family peroxide stress response transcriptional regulator
MPPNRRTIEDRMAAFRAACKAAGLKATHQRVEIFRELARTQEHPDAETVYRRVRKRIPTISLDTVYRTLATFEAHRLVTKVEALCDRARYDANLRPHHHFVCIRCGMVRDFESDALDAYRIPRAVRQWGSVTSRHVELRGICKRCAGRAGTRRAGGPVARRAARNGRSQ